MVKRLNWGCGPVLKDDWVNSDKVEAFSGKQFVKADIVIDGLPFEDGEFDYAVAHHSVCGVKPAHVNIALHELARVIKPGGVLRVTVPDVVAAYNALVFRDMDWFPNGEDTVDERFCSYVNWYGENKSLFTAPLLHSRMSTHFSHVRQYDGCDLDVDGHPRPWLAHERGTTLCKDDGILELDGRYAESIFMEGVV